MTIKELIEKQSEMRSKAAAKVATTHLYTEAIEFANDYAKRVKMLSNPSEEIEAQLKLIAKSPCGSEDYLWIIAAQLHPSKTYVDALIEILLTEEQCVWHEGIVDILYDVGDDRAVPALAHALTYVKESDPTMELAAKILETLDQIGTPAALQVLQAALSSSQPRIQEKAQQLLSIS
jgi:hypothetical protein